MSKINQKMYAILNATLVNYTIRLGGYNEIIRLRFGSFEILGYINLRL